jgi:cell division protein FtsB
MATRIKLQKRMRSAAGPALAALALLAIIGYAIAGPTGVFAWGDYRQAVATKTLELASLRAQEAELRNRVQLLDHRRADPDMVDELVRKELGVTHPDDIVIPLQADAAPAR